MCTFLFIHVRGNVLEADNLQVISQFNPTTKQIYHASVNACLAPLVSVDGKHVITVEGIGNVTRPHPAQERIAKGNGSQCGFCTPGIVMVRHSEPKLTLMYILTIL
jgi:xanthine dehydrogenase iron-sulfur cluster and FAD-binding subunit A